MKEEDRIANNKINDSVIKLGEAAIEAGKAIKKFLKAYVKTK